MLQFQVFDEERKTAVAALRNAHLMGSDNSAMRSELTFDRASGLIHCAKRETGTAALVLQVPAGDCGELTLQTCLLPDRDEPYVLMLELARHRLMMLYTKLEEWGMFDLPATHPVMRRAEVARKLFIEALCLQNEDPEATDRMASDALVAAIDGSEELALAHGNILLSRRRQTGALPKHAFGVGVRLEPGNDRLCAALSANFDYLCLPASWRLLSPAEGETRWGPLDTWIEWAGRARMPVIAGPLINFEPSAVPDWLYIWEHDYDTVRDLLYEHLERVVSRYKQVVNAWNVVSGLHVNSHFVFSFDQLMDLTRMAAMLVKKLQPAAKTLVEVRQPFGEYYAGNPRSIPPLMYADLIVQSAIPFDGFAVQVLMGQAQPGQFTRDLMQISNLLDQFAVFGRPLYVTFAAPSEPVTAMMLAVPQGEEPADENAGVWRKPWSPVVQSHWLEAVMQVALGKPFIEGVAWQEVVDHPGIDLPLSGLLTEELAPKLAMKRFVGYRRSLLAPVGVGGAGPAGVVTGLPGTVPSTASTPLAGVENQGPDEGSASN
jgi:hypothetical protein